MMIGCSFCLFFTKISILTWRDISHKSSDYSKPLYFCSNLQSNELSFFWWEITYLETTIPIISANREWWCRKIVSQGHLRTLPSEPRMDWSRPGGKTPTGFQKILCKCYIYFTLFSGRVAPLYFIKKKKKKSHEGFKSCQPKIAIASISLKNKGRLFFKTQTR